MTEYAEIRRIIDDITVSFTPIRSSVGKITYTLLNLSIYKVGRPFNPHNSDVCTIDEPPYVTMTTPMSANMHPNVPQTHLAKLRQITSRAASNSRIQTLADELHG